MKCGKLSSQARALCIVVVSIIIDQRALLYKAECCFDSPIGLILYRVGCSTYPLEPAVQQRTSSKSCAIPVWKEMIDAFFPWRRVGAMCRGEFAPLRCLQCQHFKERVSMPQTHWPKDVWKTSFYFSDWFSARRMGTWCSVTVRIKVDVSCKRICSEYVPPSKSPLSQTERLGLSLASRSRRNIVANVLLWSSRVRSPSTHVLEIQCIVSWALL